jgi:chromosome segregation ATPase
MERIARIFFVFTLLFAAAFIIFFLLYAQAKNEVTQSNVDKAALQQSVSTLSNDIRRQEILYEELERKYKALEAAASETSEINIQRLKDQIYDQQQQIAALQAQIDEKDNTIASLTDPALSTNTTETNSEQIAQVSAEYEKEINRLQEEINKQEDEISSLTEQLEAEDVDERITDLQLTLAQTQSELEKAQSQLSTLEQTLSEREQEIANLNEQLSQSSESAAIIAEKQDEIKTLEGKITRLNEQIEENRVALEEKDNEITALQGQLSSAKQEIRKLNDTLARERKYDPIPAGEADAVKYKYLLLGEDALSSGDSIKSADYFMRADLNNLALGDLHQVYSRKRDLAFQKAIAQYYNEGYEHYKKR